MSDRSHYDYQWHVDVPRALVVAYMVEALDTLQYTSHVKDLIGRMPPAGRIDAMYEVWSAMYRLDHPVERRSLHLE